MTTSPIIVAIVEDDASMRASIERLLNAHGRETRAYASAEAFIDSDSADEAACAVLDIHLGGMSGIELRRRLAASGSSLEVIFVTALDDADLELEAAKTGCIAYLHKPFSAGLLIGAVDKALQHAR